eukprot:scaffold5429_cov167-Skeletonema_dohrnii-CCMP3373.AAC.2
MACGVSAAERLERLLTLRRHQKYVNDVLLLERLIVNISTHRRHPPEIIVTSSEVTPSIFHTQTTSKMKISINLAINMDKIR